MFDVLVVKPQHACYDRIETWSGHFRVCGGGSELPESMFGVGCCISLHCTFASMMILRKLDARFGEYQHRWQFFGVNIILVVIRANGFLFNVTVQQVQTALGRALCTCLNSLHYVHQHCFILGLVLIITWIVVKYDG